jgi:hypothetical protein
MSGDPSRDAAMEASVESLKTYLAGLAHLAAAAQNGAAALARYANEFIIPYMLATNYFRDVELGKLGRNDPLQTLKHNSELGMFNLDLANRALTGALETLGEYARIESPKAAAAFAPFIFEGDLKGVQALFQRKAELLELVAVRYPATIRAIEAEYGFHFERGVNPKVAETERFLLYQILPTDTRVSVREGGKPILILPPYVLGANILGFLPGENRSYAHCFANQGIPTYIRILKDIQTTEALQVMTGEDDARDTRLFCEAIRARHGRAITLNGYCQGGFSALCNLLCGELDDLVDAFITCVAPMDGTRSEGLSSFLSRLPRRFNELDYGTKTLPNGNKLADGKLMGPLVNRKLTTAAATAVAALISGLNLYLLWQLARGG